MACARASCSRPRAAPGDSATIRCSCSPELGRTFAELGVGTKGDLSHRARAMRADHAAPALVSAAGQRPVAGNGGRSCRSSEASNRSSGTTSGASAMGNATMQTKRSSWQLFILLVVAACGPRRGPAPPRDITPSPHRDRGRSHRRPLARTRQRHAIRRSPIALVFDRQPDGGVHARLGSRGGMYLDFRFHRERDAWLLDEEGPTPGAGTRRHVLIPEGPGSHWVDRDDAAQLAIDGGRRELAGISHATARREDHAVFRLRRVTGDEAAARRPPRMRTPRYPCDDGRVGRTLALRFARPLA